MIAHFHPSNKRKPHTLPCILYPLPGAPLFSPQNRFAFSRAIWYHQHSPLYYIVENPAENPSARAQKASKTSTFRLSTPSYAQHVEMWITLSERVKRPSFPPPFGRKARQISPPEGGRKAGIKGLKMEYIRIGLCVLWISLCFPPAYGKQPPYSTVYQSPPNQDVQGVEPLFHSLHSPYYYYDLYIF